VLAVGEWPSIELLVNSGSFADTSEHKNYVDGILKEKFLSGLRLDIPDFVHKVFDKLA